MVFGDERQRSAGTGTQTPWGVLGLPRGTSPQEVKAQYRKLALQWHPDKNNGDSEQFQRITEAYHAALQEASGHRRVGGRGYYSSAGARAASRSRHVGTQLPLNAALFCATSLLVGCGLFGTAVLLGYTDMYNHNVYRGPESRLAAHPAGAQRLHIAQLLFSRKEAQQKAQQADSSSSKD